MSKENIIRDVIIDDELNLLVDIYMPPKSLTPPPKGFPTVLYQHGGAWTIGDKSRAINPCKALADSGIICVASTHRLTSISPRQLESVFIFIVSVVFAFGLTLRKPVHVYYTLMIVTLFLTAYVITWYCISGETHTHPTHVLDVSKAFKWTCENVGRYGGDSRKIVLMGHSAGGHLVTLMSTNHSYIRSVGGDPSKIAGCVGISGVYSDKRLSQTIIGRELLYNVFGKRKDYYSSFPIYNISEETPPMFLIHAESDYGLISHSFDFFHMLKQNCVWSKIEYYKNTNHMNITFNWHEGGENEKILKDVREFIVETLSLSSF